LGDTTDAPRVSIVPVLGSQTGFQLKLTF